MTWAWLATRGCQSLAGVLQPTCGPRTSGSRTPVLEAGHSRDRTVVAVLHKCCPPPCTCLMLSGPAGFSTPVTTATVRVGEAQHDDTPAQEVRHEAGVSQRRAAAHQEQRPLGDSMELVANLWHILSMGLKTPAACGQSRPTVGDGSRLCDAALGKEPETAARRMKLTAAWITAAAMASARKRQPPAVMSAAPDLTVLVPSCC